MNSIMLCQREKKCVFSSASALDQWQYWELMLSSAFAAEGEEKVELVKKAEKTVLDAANVSLFFSSLQELSYSRQVFEREVHRSIRRTAELAWHDSI